jgi:hypothetical protein
MAKKKRDRLTDQIRAAVDRCERSRYAICKELGLDQATLSRFMNGHGGMSLARLDDLADLLDLKISLAPRPPKKGT